MEGWRHGRLLEVAGSDETGTALLCQFSSKAMHMQGEAIGMCK
jgi:hypothetical protein